MEKIRPSERIGKEISQLLEGGVEEGQDILGQLIEKSVRKVLQEILEQEVEDYLGRGYYQRGERKQRGYRNGYETKKLKTAEGRMGVEVPQLRDTEETYRSALLGKVGPRSGELERLVVEMYTRGLSTRDIEDTLKDETGKLMISRSGVSQITEALSEEYERFSSRDLSGYDVVYLFVDGVHEALRLEGGLKEALLCAWGVCSNGRKVLLHLALGNKESYVCWRDFFRDMISRGLRMPLLVCSDGAPGLIRALQECFSQSRRQRCIFHKLSNIASKLPESVKSEVMPKVRAVFSQTDREIAMLYVTKLVEEYASVYPAAIKCLQDDLESSLSYMDFPVGHHKHIRTTNLLERCFVEQRRRTKIIPRFLDEKSCLKLVYATLIRVSERWQKVNMSAYDLTLLKNLRKLYGWEEDENGFISKKLAA